MLFSTLFILHAYGQKSIQKRFEAFTINDGLSQGFVSSIVQDKKGLMWFATGDGLNKYDGYAFTVYHHVPDDSTSLVSDDLTCVFEDSKGRLWIGTRQNGIDLFDPEKKTFAHLRQGRGGGLRSNYIRDIQEDGLGALWVQTRSGIDRVEIADGISPLLLSLGGHAWQQYTLLFTPIVMEKAFEAVKDKYGPENLFIGSRNRILITTNNKLWELIYDHVTHTYHLQEKFRFPVYDSAYVPLMLEDTVDHSLLLNTSEVVRFARYDFRAPEKMFGYSPYPVKWAIDRSRQLWISDKGQVAQVSLETGHLQHIVSAEPVHMQALAASTVFFTDRTGVVWIGTGGFGLLKYDPEIERFHHILPNTITYQIALDDSGKIINNHLQEITITKGRFPVVRNIIDSALLKKKFPKVGVVSFAKDTGGNLWIGIHGGIIKYHLATGKLVRYNLPYTNFVTQPFPVYADKNNNIWMGYNRYFVRYAPATGVFTKFSYPAKAVSYDFDFLQCIYEDGGILWLGSVSGLFGFDVSTEKMDRYYVHHQDNSASLSNNFILSLCSDSRQPEKYLWIGTKGGGLNRLDKAGGAFVIYNTGNGLANNVVYGILPDSDGNLWLSTNKGLSTLNRITSSFLNYDVKDGLQSNEFNRYAYCKTAEGTLFFGGMNGLNYFDPREIKPLPPPDVVFTAFRLFNEQVGFNKISVPVCPNVTDARKIVLRHEQNVITFQFAGTDYRRRGAIQYRYRMKGFDKDWIYAGVFREATYTNLDPGDYVFMVQASFMNGSWGTRATSLGITVIPPWWRTWWFYCCLSAVTSSALYALYQYRIRQIQRLEQIRNRIARDLHDEVGSSISTIAIYSKIVHEQSHNETFDNEPLIKKISDYSTDIMEAMNDIVWNINTKNDAFEHIVNRMREHAYQLLEAKGYNLYVNFDEALNQTKLTMEKRRDFYLIYKEALNNVAKYANGKNIWITLRMSSNAFHLTIRDDGKGFDAEVISKGGNGLANMHYRASALNGTIKITTRPGAGTEVSLVFSGSR